MTVPTQIKTFPVTEGNKNVSLIDINKKIYMYIKTSPQIIRIEQYTCIILFIILSDIDKLMVHVIFKDDVYEAYCKRYASKN